MERPLFYNEVESVIICSTVGKMPCAWGYSEQRRICANLHGPAVRHELQDAEPAVTAVSFPAAAEGLDIEHHLMDLVAMDVLVHSPAHIPVIPVNALAVLLLRTVSMMSAKHKTDVRNLAHKLLPKLNSGSILMK